MFWCPQIPCAETCMLSSLSPYYIYLFSKTVPWLDKKKNMQRFLKWNASSNLMDIPFTGLPYLTVGSKTYGCQFGRQKHAKTKVSSAVLSKLGYQHNSEIKILIRKMLVPCVACQIVFHESFTIYLLNLLIVVYCLLWSIKGTCQQITKYDDQKLALYEQILKKTQY